MEGNRLKETVYGTSRPWQDCEREAAADLRRAILELIVERAEELARLNRELQAIFQIFRRLHPRDAFGGGAGAGLTITRRTIERHGGQIWVESVPGEGSTFYFTLAPVPS